jgi:hypothetical protein
MTAKHLLSAATALALSFSSAVFADEVPSPTELAAGVPGWTLVSPGVYESIAPNGNVYRTAIGVDGATHDLQLLTSELRSLSIKARADEYRKNLLTEIASIQDFLNTSNNPAPDNEISTGNSGAAFCGYVAHQMSDGYQPLGLGGSNVNAISSIMYFNYFYSASAATYYVSATATPYGGTGTSVNSTAHQTSTSAAGPLLLTVGAHNTLEAFSGTFSTYSTFTVSSCTGGFQSFSGSGSLTSSS